MPLATLHKWTQQEKVDNNDLIKWPPRKLAFWSKAALSQRLKTEWTSSNHSACEGWPCCYSVTCGASGKKSIGLLGSGKSRQILAVHCIACMQVHTLILKQHGNGMLAMHGSKGAVMMPSSH
ncbi:TPA: hypothetical protein ACH3X2_011324 [Trebouxia sp. C0005]